MWILRSASASPFVRKVRIAAAICGLEDRIKIEVADTTDPTDSLRNQNPLGKIPALVLEDGTVLYDSAVIADFLDSEAGGGVIIPKGRQRFSVLTMQALADGMKEAAVLKVYENRFRAPEMHNARWLEHHTGKIDRGLATFEAAPPSLSNKPDIGRIALACALGYLDLRFEGTWRQTHPRLVAWLNDFAARVPSFEATRPS